MTTDQPSGHYVHRTKIDPPHDCCYPDDANDGDIWECPDGHLSIRYYDMMSRWYRFTASERFMYLAFGIKPNP